MAGECLHREPAIRVERLAQRVREPVRSLESTRASQAGEGNGHSESTGSCNDKFVSVVVSHVDQPSVDCVATVGNQNRVSSVSCRDEKRQSIPILIRCFGVPHDGFQGTLLQGLVRRRSG